MSMGRALIGAMEAAAMSSALHSFLRETTRACDRVHAQVQPDLIRELGDVAGRFIETTRRAGGRAERALDLEGYARLVVELMGEAGAPVRVESISAHEVRLVNDYCPFADPLGASPRLCHLASSLFGTIAARSFGYARASFARCMMLGDSRCELSICTDRTLAQRTPARDYPGIQAAAELALPPPRSAAQGVWRPPCPRGKPVAEAPEPIIVARSPAMQRAVQAVETVGPTAATVLVSGETGVGKELIARAVHGVSERRAQPFEAVNCGAIPETLIQSALFGHERGAFTGAYETRAGVFERAGEGTLFLDEVNSLSPAAQTTLLRVLQEGEYTRVGGRARLQAKARIVAATNRPLAEEVRRGAFRQDLFYRLEIVHLTIPPLRERIEDIPALIEHVLARLCRRYARQITRVSATGMDRLLRHPWPGNVRELENVLERSFLFSAGPTLEVLMEPLTFREPAAEALEETAAAWRDYRKNAVCKMERDYLLAALKRFGGDVRRVAERMDLTPRAVYMKMRLHGIHAGQYRA